MYKYIVSCSMHLYFILIISYLQKNIWVFSYGHIYVISHHDLNKKMWAFALYTNFCTVFIKGKYQGNKIYNITHIILITG